MAFPAETLLGPYKIVSLIGAGGMGEVYRAGDTRLQRDVALKVLPASFTTDADRLRRFEQEARAVAALNHPNIVSVFDIGSAEGVHFIVSELLEGETLRQRIPATGLPSRKAVDYAVQLAQGLAAAHERGIVHRDLKPENIFITRNGRVKILDFGLAKLRRPHEETETVDGESTLQTSVGQVLGTAGYMSPEQVRGEAADYRSDIFSFGCILHEMLTGRRAFKRNTSAETMTAILNEEPPEIAITATTPVAPALERIVRHCLEKQPGQRFQSAQDIAFDLESLSQSGGTSPAQASATPQRRWLPAAVAGLVMLLAGAALGAWLRPAAPEIHPKLHRVTFRRGTIWGARFTPDGNVIYGAAWEGQPSELYANQAGSTESRPLSMASTNVLSISSTGELAVASQFVTHGFLPVGMLGRVPSAGGAPRDLAAGISYADWSRDGESLCVVRRVNGKSRLEYPLGKVLYETAGWVSHPRISRDGKYIAFLDHPYDGDDSGTVAVVDLAGNKKTLTTEFVSAQGLAWSPTDEVWFTATPSGSSRELRAVTLAGKERLVHLGTGTLTLHDIFKDGRVLFSRDDMRAGMLALAPGETRERDLSWHDWTIPRDLSNDGKVVAFDETGEAGGETGEIYVRGTDGSPAVRLSDGSAPAFSPDGKWVIGRSFSLQHALLKLPTGAGESTTIPTGDVQAHQAFFFPDGRHILLMGNQAGHGLRLWIHDINGGNPRPISPEGATLRRRGDISPDGKQVAAADQDGIVTLYPVNGGNPQPARGAEPHEEPLQWTPDGNSLLVGPRGVPARVFMLNLKTGERKLFKSFMPADATGLFGNAAPSFSSDLNSYVYAYQRITSDLYIVDGLK